MGGILSYHKTKKVSPEEQYDNAVLNAKVTRDRLKKYQARLSQEADQMVQTAKELIKNNKTERAKMVIRQKRQKESLISKTDAMLNNIQAQLDSMEQKKIEMSVVESLKETNAILDQFNKLMPIEEVEKLMDENEEQADRIEEVSNLLAEGMSQADIQYADEEYEAMLDELVGVKNKSENKVESKVEEEENEQSEEKVAMLA